MAQKRSRKATPLKPQSRRISAVANGRAVSSASGKCNPQNEAARKIISVCVGKHPATKTDCNGFLKAVAAEFFGPDIFRGKNADGILEEVRTPGSGWTITKSIPEAISAAKQGSFVAAGMTSKELGHTKGHVAVVIGCDGQPSGSKTVPLGYAGSEDAQRPELRIAGEKLSFTFQPALVQQEKISYFYRTPAFEPLDSAFSLLWHGLPTLQLAWGRMVSEAFREKTISLCAGLGVDPNHLMVCMPFETGETFIPSIQNPHSKAVGLIQFLPSTTKALGTTIDALAQMSTVEQLDYVERYLATWKGHYATLSDLYMAILYPAAIGKPETHVLFAEGSPAYEQNRGLDHDLDGKITKAEATRHVDAKLQKGLSPGFIG